MIGFAETKGFGYAEAALSPLQRLQKTTGINLLPANIAGDEGQWQTVYVHGRNLLRPLLGVNGRGRIMIGYAEAGALASPKPKVLATPKLRFRPYKVCFFTPVRGFGAFH